VKLFRRISVTRTATDLRKMLLRVALLLSDLLQLYLQDSFAKFSADWQCRITIFWSHASKFIGYLSSSLHDTQDMAQISLHIWKLNWPIGWVPLLLFTEYHSSCCEILIKKLSIKKIGGSMLQPLGYWLIWLCKQM